MGEVKIDKTIKGFYCYIPHSDGFASYLGNDEMWFRPYCVYPSCTSIKFFKTEQMAILAGNANSKEKEC